LVLYSQSCNRKGITGRLQGRKGVAGVALSSKSIL
jgi:hypothetical protein